VAILEVMGGQKGIDNRPQSIIQLNDRLILELNNEILELRNS
jgi:hypothetical protein